MEILDWIRNTAALEASFAGVCNIGLVFYFIKSIPKKSPVWSSVGQLAVLLAALISGFLICVAGLSALNQL